MDPRNLAPGLPGSRRMAHFSGPEQKARWLDAAASEDATDPELRRFAQRFAWRGPELRDPRVIVRELFRFVRDSIAYVRDWGGREEFADTATILRRKFDDCDGKARAFVALVRALGIPTVQARIRPVFKGRRFVHVQAEVRYPGSKGDRSDANGWQLAELIVRGVDIGDDPETIGERDAAGHLVMSGPPPPDPGGIARR